MREAEGGWLNRTFIGRHDEREQIKTRLFQDDGILLLFGQPLVGKASLALQVGHFDPVFWGLRLSGPF